MAGTFNPAGGAQTVVGFGIENQAAPGVVVPPTTFLAVDPDSLEGGFNPNRSTENLAVGSIFNKQRVTDKAGEVTGKIKIPLSDVAVMSFLCQCGFMDTLTGTAVTPATTPATYTAPYTHTLAMTRPKFISLYIQRAGQCEVYAGLLCKSGKLTFNSKQTAYLEADFEGLKRPADAAPLMPVFLKDYTYGATDLQPSQLQTDLAQVSVDVEDFELNWMFTLDRFYGAGGGGLPTYLVPVEADVTAKATKIFRNADAYNAFRAAAPTPGLIKFGVGNTPQRSVTCALPGAYVPKHNWKTPSAGTTVEDFEYATDHAYAAVPLTIVVVNGDTTVYAAA